MSEWSSSSGDRRKTERDPRTTAIEAIQRALMAIQVASVFLAEYPAPLKKLPTRT